MAGHSIIGELSGQAVVGKYWGSHDLTDRWGKTGKGEFDVVIESERTYCAIQKDLSEKVQSIAREKGVSPETLINLWIQGKVQEQLPG